MQTTDLATSRPISIFKGSNSNLATAPMQNGYANVSGPIRRDQPPSHSNTRGSGGAQMSVPYRTYNSYNRNNNRVPSDGYSSTGPDRANGHYSTSQDITDADDNTKRFYGNGDR